MPDKTTNDDKILLLYTERYDDFSFPGGGVDTSEDKITALARELREEAGVIMESAAPFGMVTEYQPYWKPNLPLMYQTSYWYECQVSETTVATAMEHYEIANGMGPRWVSLADAIRHNDRVIKTQPPTIGLSIYRETLVLKAVAEERTR